MGKDITRPIFKKQLNYARIELAEARARAAKSIARLHASDAGSIRWLARDHYAQAHQKWGEFVAARGETKEVARYEFLVNLRLWLDFVEKPDVADLTGLRTNELFIVGFFGTDAVLVTRRSAKDKAYRLLSDKLRPRKSDPYLRYPGTTRLELPDGDSMTLVECSHSRDERLICLNDSLVVVAIVRDGQLRYRAVGAGEKFALTPLNVRGSSSTFVDADGLLGQIKRDMGRYTAFSARIKHSGGDTDSIEEVIRRQTGPMSRVTPTKAPTQRTERTRTPTGDTDVHDINSAILDDVDPLQVKPQVTRFVVTTTAAGSASVSDTTIEPTELRAGEVPPPKIANTTKDVRTPKAKAPSLDDVNEGVLDDVDPLAVRGAIPEDDEESSEPARPSKTPVRSGSNPGTGRRTSSRVIRRFAADTDTEARAKKGGGAQTVGETTAAELSRDIAEFTESPAERDGSERRRPQTPMSPRPGALADTEWMRDD